MNVVAASDAAALAGILDAGWNAPDSVAGEVAAIVDGVRARRDAALVEYARRFDDRTFELSKLRVAIPMLDSARFPLPPEVASALELARERIARFHQRQRQPETSYVDEDGSRSGLQRRPSPFGGGLRAAQRSGDGGVDGRRSREDRGGRARRRPDAGRRRRVPPAVLFACALCGVDELYAVGGAHAVAAAAYGTESVAPVDKIVGRGGAWTTEAKRRVFGRCGIDALAGVPEVLVVADDGASSEYVVGELLAQAERPGVTRLAVLSESRPLLEAVAQLIDTLDLRDGRSQRVRERGDRRRTAC